MPHQTGAQVAISRRSLLFGPDRKSAEPSLEPVASIDQTCLSLRGIACRACDDACAENAIRFEARPGGHYHPSVKTHLCTACGDCLPACPVTAITISGSTHP